MQPISFPSATSIELTNPSFAAVDLSTLVLERACASIDPHVTVLRRFAAAANTSSHRPERVFLQTQLKEVWHSGNLVAQCLATLFPEGLPDGLRAKFAELQSVLDEIRELF